MTRTCVVFSCRAGYWDRDGDTKVRNKCPVFKFPFVPTEHGHIDDLLKPLPEDSNDRVSAKQSACQIQNNLW